MRYHDAHRTQIVGAFLLSLIASLTIASCSLLADEFGISPKVAVPAPVESKPAEAEDKPIKSPEVLIFTASWCGPCQTLHTLLPQMSRNGWITVNDGDDGPRHFRLVQFTADHPLVKKYQVSMLPTFVMIAPDGTEIASHVGVLDRTGLMEFYRKPVLRVSSAAMVKANTMLDHIVQLVGPGGAFTISPSGPVKADLDTDMVLSYTKLVGKYSTTGGNPSVTFAEPFPHLDVWKWHIHFGMQVYSIATDAVGNVSVQTSSGRYSVKLEPVP